MPTWERILEKLSKSRSRKIYRIGIIFIKYRIEIICKIFASHDVFLEPPITHPFFDENTLHFL